MVLRSAIVYRVREGKGESAEVGARKGWQEGVHLTSFCGVETPSVLFGRESMEGFTSTKFRDSTLESGKVAWT